MHKQLLLILGGSAGQLLLALFSSIAAARLLDSQGRGELAALLMLPAILQQLASFGTPQALTYFTAQQLARPGTLLGSSLALIVIVAAPVIATATLALPWVLGRHSEVLNYSVRTVTLPLLTISLLYGLPASVLLGRKDYLHFNIQRLLASALYLAAVLSAGLAGDALSIVQCYQTGLLLLGLPYVAWVYGKTVGDRVRLDLRVMSAMLPYSFVTWLSALPQIAGQRLDQIVTLAALSLFDLGQYSIAVGLGQAYQTLLSAAGTLLLPHLANVQTDPGRRALLFARVFRVALLITAATLIIGVAVLPALIPLLFGREYLPAVAVAQLLLVAYGAAALSGVLCDGFRGCGWPRLALWVEVANVCVRAVCFYAWYNAVDLTVIARISTAGALVALGLATYFFHHHVYAIDLSWVGRCRRYCRYLVIFAQGVLARWK